MSDAEHERRFLFAALVFLRTIDDLRLPVVNEKMTLEQLQAAAAANGETWIPAIIERQKWMNHVVSRLQRGAIMYGNRSFTRQIAELLDELSVDTADLGAWAAIAHQALSARDDLEDDQRALVTQALRDVAIAGAQAWARIDQARALLAGNDGGEPSND